ncbi:hypothetical protein NFJ02_41g107530 [Pycnococcus provasolii]
MAPASLPSPVPASGAGACENENNESSSNGSEEWLLVKSAGKGYKGSKGSKVSETRASPSLNHDNMQQQKQTQTHANGVGSKQQQHQQHQSSSGSSASTPPSSSANATAAATTTTTTTTTTTAVTGQYNHQKTTTPPPQPPAAAASPPARRDSSEERQRRQDSFKRKGKAAMSDTGGDHQSTPNGTNGQTSIHQTPGHRRGNSSGAIQLVSPPPSPKAAEVLATLTSPSITAPLAGRPMAVYDSDDDETVSNRSGGASSSGASLAGLTYNNHSSSQHLPAAGAPAAVTSDEGGPSYYDLTQVPVDIDELSRLVGTLEKPHQQPKQRKKHSQQQQRQQQQQQQQHHHHQQQSTWEDMLHRLSDYLLIAYRCCDADFHAVLRKAVVEQAAFPLQLADKDVINLLENRVLKPPSHATPASPTSSSSPKSPTAVDDDDEAAHNAALEAVALRLLQAIVADGSVPSTIAPAPAPAGSLVPQMNGGGSAQASPRQTKVGYLVMFAALARRHPATVLSIASELASSVHFTGASRVPALVWAYAQAANGSRAAGLALWSRNLLPLLLTPVPSSSSSSSSSLASSPAPPLVRGCGSPAPHGVGPSPSSSSSSKKKKKKEKGGSAAKSNAAADGGKSAATAPRPPPPSMDVHRKLAASFLSFVLSAKLPETPHTSFATTKPTATAAAAAAAAPVPASSLVQFLQVCHVPGRGGLEQSEAKRLGQLYPRLRAAALRLASKKGLGPHDSFAVGLLRAVLQAASEYADRASDAAAAAASDTPATPPRGGWFRKRSDPPQLASPDHKALSADPFIVELASLMQWCLEGDLVCYDEWRRLYIDHLLGSTLLLHAMANAADDASSRGKRSTSANGKKAGGSMNSTASAALCDSMLRQVAHFDQESAPSTAVSERKRPRWAPAWLPFFGSMASSGAKAALSNQNAVGPLDHLQYTQEQWQAAAAAAERMRAALGVPRRQAKGSFQPYVVIAMVAVLVLISLIAGAVQVRADRLAWTSDAPYTIERGARVMCRELLSVVLPPRGSAGMCGVDVAPWLAALDGANEESAQATLGIV